MASPAGGGLAGAGAEQVSGKPLARNLRSLMHRPSLHLPQRSLAPSDHEFCVLAVTQVSLFLPGCGDGLSLCSMPHAAATAWHPTGGSLLQFCGAVATTDEAQAQEDAAFCCALAGGHLIKGSWSECPRPILPAAMSGSSAVDSSLPCTAFAYGGRAEPAEYTLASFYGLPAGCSEPTLRVCSSHLAFARNAQPRVKVVNGRNRGCTWNGAHSIAEQWLVRGCWTTALLWC